MCTDRRRMTDQPPQFTPPWWMALVLPALMIGPVLIAWWMEAH